MEETAVLMPSLLDGSTSGSGAMTATQLDSLSVPQAPGTRPSALTMSGEFLWRYVQDACELSFVMGGASDSSSIIGLTEARMMVANLRGVDVSLIRKGDRGVRQLRGKAVSELREFFHSMELDSSKGSTLLKDLALGESGEMDEKTRAKMLRIQFAAMEKYARRAAGMARRHSKASLSVILPSGGAGASSVPGLDIAPSAAAVKSLSPRHRHTHTSSLLSKPRSRPGSRDVSPSTSPRGGQRSRKITQLSISKLEVIDTDIIDSEAMLEEKEQTPMHRPLGPPSPTRLLITAASHTDSPCVVSDAEVAPYTLDSEFLSSSPRGAHSADISICSVMATDGEESDYDIFDSSMPTSKFIKKLEPGQVSESFSKSGIIMEPPMIIHGRHGRGRDPSSKDVGMKSDDLLGVGDGTTGANTMNFQPRGMHAETYSFYNSQDGFHFIESIAAVFGDIDGSHSSDDGDDEFDDDEDHVHSGRFLSGVIGGHGVGKSGGIALSPSLDLSDASPTGHGGNKSLSASPMAMSDAALTMGQEKVHLRLALLMHAPCDV